MEAQGWPWSKVKTEQERSPAFKKVEGEQRVLRSRVNRLTELLVRLDDKYYRLDKSRKPTGDVERERERVALELRDVSLQLMRTTEQLERLRVAVPESLKWIDLTKQRERIDTSDAASDLEDRVKREEQRLNRKTRVFSREVPQAEWKTNPRAHDLVVEQRKQQELKAEAREARRRADELSPAPTRGPDVEFIYDPSAPPPVVDLIPTSENEQSPEPVYGNSSVVSSRPRQKRLTSRAMRTAAASRRSSKITAESGMRYRDAATGRFVSMRTLR